MERLTKMARNPVERTSSRDRAGGDGKGVDNLGILHKRV